jgi:hypothetical protein
VDAAPWQQQQQQQPPQQQQGSCSSMSNSPGANMGQQQQQLQPVPVNRSVDGTPWFAGGGGRVGSTQQISSHVHPVVSSTTARAPTSAGLPPAAAAPASFEAQQHAAAPAPAAAAPQPPQQQQPSSSTLAHATAAAAERADALRAGRTPSPMQLQASAADLGFTGSTLPLSRDMLGVVEVMAATKQLEDELLGLCKERDDLEKELAKMPVGAGRTIKGRQRKMAVESRLDDLGLDISRLRTEIKRLNGQIKR